jgi:hypothetical protein|tara:strand:- start:67 stop:471 length:405 start_codon:yes stop_codon:yes gene_type:complete
MIIRRSSQGERIRIHRNTTPGVTRTKTYPDGSTETLTYPSSYTYFVEVDGEILKKSNSFKTIEEFYVDECAKKYDNGHGRLIIGTHKIINFIATSPNEIPTDSNTKDEIKTFLDSRDISYKSSDTKDELLARIP